MESIHPWLGYANVVPPGFSVEELLGLVRGWNRKEALRGLSVIAFELSKSAERSARVEAEAWRLLTEVPTGAPRQQRELAVALAQLPHRSRIVHEQGVLTLQQLVLSESADDGPIFPGGQLALALLAINDHLSAPARPGPASGLADLTALLAFYHQFNVAFEVDMNFIVRVWQLFTQAPNESVLSAEAWKAIQFRALGCLAGDYLEAFAFPLIILSQEWGKERAAVLDTREWPDGPFVALAPKWFKDASLPLDEWRTSLRCEASSGSAVVPRLTQAYLRTPMVADGSDVLVLSRSALRTHVLAGLWGRLNTAAKKEEPQGDGNSFRTAFGDWFERWAQQVAAAAKQDGLFGDHLIDTATDRELPDLVFRRGRLVVFVEVKTMVVPEDKLKTADTLVGLRSWLDERLFAPRRSREKGGAIPQLDAAVRRLRAGDWRRYGLHPDARVIPVLLTLDKLPGATALPGWLDQESSERGLLQDGDVLPVVSLGPFDFETLLSYARTNGGVANLLARKVQSLRHRGRAFDQFILDKSVVRAPRDRRLPSYVREFETITGIAQEDEPPTV